MKAFKVTLHGTDTTRIVPSPDPYGSCWFNLSETIRERFTLSPDVSFEFKYIDNDGDSITVSSTPELLGLLHTSTVDVVKAILVVHRATAESTNGTESVSSTEAIHAALKNITVVPTGAEQQHDEDESDLFSELGSEESLEDLAERERGDKGKGREWDLVSMEEGQDATEDDTPAQFVDTPTSTATVDTTHSNVEVEDPEEDVLPPPEVTPTSTSSDDPAEVPLPTGTPPTAHTDPFATLRASLAEAFPSLPIPNFALPPGLDPTSIERIASLISLAPLAPLAEVPSLVRDIGTEITSIVGLVFKGFREEAENVREEFERFKKEMEERKKEEDARQENERERERESTTKGGETEAKVGTATETREEKTARRTKKKAAKEERKVQRDIRKGQKYADRAFETEVEGETSTRPSSTNIAPNPPSPPALSTRPASDPFYYQRPRPSMPGTFEIPPAPRTDPFGFATPAFRLPTPPPPRMPGSFHPHRSTHHHHLYHPIPSTSTRAEWSEVTPADLRSAVKELGMDMRDVGVNIVVERVWEEMRGKRVEQMVQEVVERLL